MPGTLRTSPELRQGGLQDTTLPGSSTSGVPDQKTVNTTVGQVPRRRTSRYVVQKLAGWHTQRTSMAPFVTSTSPWCHASRLCEGLYGQGFGGNALCWRQGTCPPAVYAPDARYHSRLSNDPHSIRRPAGETLANPPCASTIKPLCAGDPRCLAWPEHRENNSGRLQSCHGRRKG